MKRREVLKAAVAVPLAALVPEGHAQSKIRVRPGEPGWPAAAEWERLRAAVEGRLITPVSPFEGGGTVGLSEVRDPFFLGDNPALTETSGWVDAWHSQPSTYAVVAQEAADVAAAVNFARRHNLRLVVKGGGHSYQGTSNAADSLLVWTRRMNAIQLHPGFVGQGCAGRQAPQPAVSVGAGAMWGEAYRAVSVEGGRYVQGGGCMTVGVAGLVQSGGFGSWSKRFGTAAAGLLEAEVVTADGEIRIANACQNPDLFWALKGGGGGTFGVVTRLTLRTRELPAWFGWVSANIKPATDAAYRALIARALDFYRTSLMNPHWGEKMSFNGTNFDVGMLFQGLTEEQARNTWAPFFDWVRARPEYAFNSEPRVESVPGKRFWDTQYMATLRVVRFDVQPGAAQNRGYWTDDAGEAGWFIHGYKTAWLPAALLTPARRPALVDAIFATRQHWSVSFHFNKGLAGAGPEEIAAARNTATNPDVLDAFCCAFIAGGGPPAFAGMPGSGPDLGRRGRMPSGSGSPWPSC